MGIVEFPEGFDAGEMGLPDGIEGLGDVGEIVLPDGFYAIDGSDEYEKNGNAPANPDSRSGKDNGKKDQDEQDGPEIQNLPGHPCRPAYRYLRKLLHPF